MIALLVITDGRKDCIARTIPSAIEQLDGPINEWWMYDDSGDAEHRDWLMREFPQFTLIWHVDGRQGFGGAIREAWEIIGSQSAAEYVFHLEDDFTFNRPVPLDDMMEVLDENPLLAQVALRRQAWNDLERAAGGVIEVQPAAYVDVRGHDYSYLVHDLFWTTNPSLYRRSLLTETEWPIGKHSEGMFTIALLERGYRFAYFGERTDAPWVHHIGTERAGKGY